MEILNKNQRQTAIWRLVGMGLLIVAVNAVIIFSIHRASSNIGTGPINEVRKQLQACQATANGKGVGQNNKIKELETKIKTMETEKATMTTEYKLMKTRNDFLEKDLMRCQMTKGSPPN